MKLLSPLAKLHVLAKDLEKFLYFRSLEKLFFFCFFFRRRYVRGLNMSRFTLGKDDNEESLYDLFAVANHSGTVSFGHYTAVGRLAEADHPTNGLSRDGLGLYTHCCSHVVWEWIGRERGSMYTA